MGRRSCPKANPYLDSLAAASQPFWVNGNGCNVGAVLLGVWNRSASIAMFDDWIFSNVERTHRGTCPVGECISLDARPGAWKGDQTVFNYCALPRYADRSHIDSRHKFAPWSVEAGWQYFVHRKDVPAAKWLQKTCKLTVSSTVRAAGLCT